MTTIEEATKELSAFIAWLQATPGIVCPSCRRWVVQGAVVARSQPRVQWVPTCQCGASAMQSTPWMPAIYEGTDHDA